MPDKEKDNTIHKTGLLIDKDGKAIPGASGILVDGVADTIKKTKEAVEGITGGVKKGADIVGTTVKEAQPTEVTAQSVDPGEVAQNTAAVQESVKQTDAATADPTDWKAKYDELSAQMADLQKKYADRFTGTSTEPTTLSSDAQAAVNTADKLASGEDVDIPDLFTEAATHTVGRTKDIGEKVKDDVKATFENLFK